MSGGPSEASATSLYIMSYDEHEPVEQRHTVWGGPDEDTYIGSFHDRGTAQFFIDVSMNLNMTHKGIRGSP